MSAYILMFFKFVGAIEPRNWWINQRTGSSWSLYFGKQSVARGCLFNSASRMWPYQFTIVTPINWINISHYINSMNIQICDFDGDLNIVWSYYYKIKAIQQRMKNCLSEWGGDKLEINVAMLPYYLKHHKWPNFLYIFVIETKFHLTSRPLHRNFMNLLLSY